VSFEIPPGWRLDPSIGPQASVGQYEEVVGLAKEGEGAAMVVGVQRLNEPVAEWELPIVRLEWERVTEQLARQMDGELVSKGPARAGAFRGFTGRIRYPNAGETFISRQVDVFDGDRQYSIVLETEESEEASHAPALDHLLSSLEVRR
jgi:hypothetical protein